MSAATGAMLGVSATVFFGLACYCGYKAWRWVVGFYNLLLRGVRAAEGIQAELGYMRSLTGGTLGEQQVGGDPDYGIPTLTPGPGPGRSNVLHPFPEPLMERFPQEPPDAKVEKGDLDLLNQTDAELAAMEVLETMRARGIPVEDSDTEHPGITVESK